MIQLLHYLTTQDEHHILHWSILCLTIYPVKEPRSLDKGSWRNCRPVPPRDDVTPPQHHAWPPSGQRMNRTTTEREGEASRSTMTPRNAHPRITLPQLTRTSKTRASSQLAAWSISRIWITAITGHSALRRPKRHPAIFYKNWSAQIYGIYKINTRHYIRHKIEEWNRKEIENR